MAIYKDIDLSFSRHPGTGDVTRVFDVAAAKQALKRLVRFSAYDSPFDKNCGVGINGLLFEMYTPALSGVVKRKIQEQVDLYQPRIVLEDVAVTSHPNTNSMDITITFYVIGYPLQQSLNVAIERTR